MNRWCAQFLLLVLIAFYSACSAKVSVTPLQHVVAVRELDSGSHVAGLGIAPNGDLWLATLNYGSESSGVVHVRAKGDIQRFPRRESFNRVAIDPSGTAWLTVGAGSSGQQPKLVRIDPNGRMRDYPLPVEGNFQGIAIGPDAAPWFVDAAGSEIGRVAPGGGITYYGPASADPTEIVSGPGRALWFTEPVGNLIGRLRIDGALKEFRLPTAAGHPTGITADSRGNVWFCESAADKIGRITPSGSITEFRVPTRGAWPAGIAAARDGSLWFTELMSAKIGHIKADDGSRARWSIAEYSVPGNGYPGAIVRAPDGDVWVAINAKRDAVLGLIASRSRILRFNPVGL